MVGAPGGLPAVAVSRSSVALRATADSLHGHGSEGWAHFEFTRINITPTILRKKIEELCEARALMSVSRRPFHGGRTIAVEVHHNVRSVGGSTQVIIMKMLATSLGDAEALSIRLGAGAEHLLKPLAHHSRRSEPRLAGYLLNGSRARTRLASRSLGGGVERVPEQKNSWIRVRCAVAGQTTSSDVSNGRPHATQRALTLKT